MDAAGKTLFWFSEEDLIIEVPFFQRPYVWDEENWQSLIESIESADDKRLPFIGSFILQEKGNKTYWVIDGQQRINTLSIFIKAFLDSTKFQILSLVRTKLEGMIYRQELIDGDTVNYTSRLIPSNADREPFEKVMNIELDQSSLEEGKTNIEDCYLYFKDYIGKLSQDEFKSLTNKLITTAKYVIAITLDSKDDEQGIFDTVNSLGKRLTNSDIVKNYLYQKMKGFADGNDVLVKKVLEHYNKYWEKVFIDSEYRDFWDTKISLGRITTTNLDAFLKDYATIKGIYVPSESGGIEGLSKEYKKHIDRLSKDELEAFSIELSSYAKAYYDMWKDYRDCNDFRISDYLNTTLLILDQLETSTFNPYLLKLVKNKDSDISNKLFGLQKFVLKRFLWKASKKNYNKCCLEVLKSDNPNKYFEDYNTNTDGIDWNAYPMQIKNIANKQATLLLFVIEMIRRNNNGEDNYSDTLIYNKSLEHIMPKKWKEHWFSVPSYRIDENGGYLEVPQEEKEANRKVEICSLGNMTLLNAKLNSKISNDEFCYKIDGKHNKKGIRNFVGSLSIANEIVLRYDLTKKWDEIDIIERELSLANELNSYFGFGDEIKQNVEEKVKENIVNVDSSYFSDEYFNTHKIGVIAKESFTYLFNNGLLTDEEIESLKLQPYSSQTFGVWLPIIEVDPSKLYDVSNFRRYYKDSIVKGQNIFLCREWVKERSLEKLLTWLKPRLQRDKKI